MRKTGDGCADIDGDIPGEDEQSEPGKSAFGIRRGA